MREFKWVERTTNKIWLAFIIWLILAGIAKLNITSDIGGEILPATLEVVGFYFFGLSIWKWFKKRKQ